MKKSQNSLTRENNKFFNNGKEISKATFYRIRSEEKSLRKDETVSERPQRITRKRNLEQEKELIDYKALSQYIGISQLAEMYRKHFGNKTIRVTGRLKRYINQPEDMIRMSLILERNR